MRQLSNSLFSLTRAEAGDRAWPDCVVVVWENSWAARLATAIRGSHGQVVVQERIPRDTVLRAIAALDQKQEAACGDDRW